LGDGDRAFQIVKHLITPELTYPNMFDAHPPFQIDGNFGGARAIAEMLLQSHVPAGEVTSAVGDREYEIELLPALPSAWPNGSVRGLRARGGFEVDVEWKEGRLARATIRSAPGGTAHLRWGEMVARLHVPRGGEVTWDGR
jgi:alpha-L-fucosidase 2